MKSKQFQVWRWLSESTHMINNKELYTADCTKANFLLFMTNKVRIYDGEEVVSSVSGAGKTGQLCVKE